MTSRADVTAILDALKKRYPRGSKPWASRSDPFQTLIATILSAQTTDDQVDRVTPELFRRFSSPSALARANPADVRRIIKPVGLHQAKAKNIVAASRMLIEKFCGNVPATREEMVELPGVGRKTANVVLIKAFGIPAMPVDTHVFRVATRMGIATNEEARQARQAGLARHARHETRDTRRETDIDSYSHRSRAKRKTPMQARLTPEEVERQLVEIIPKRLLGAAHFWLIHHGRTVCTARNPQCGTCNIAVHCDSHRSRSKTKNSLAS